MVETRRTSTSGRAGSHRLSTEDLSPRLEATMDLIARTMANRREQRAMMDEAAMREAEAQRQHAEDYNNNAANSMIQGAVTGATIGSMIPVVGTAAGAIGGTLLGGIAGVASAEDKGEAFRSAINPLNWVKTGGEYLMGASEADDRDAGLGMQRALQIATLGAQAIPKTTSTGAPVQSLWDRWMTPTVSDPTALVPTTGAMMGPPSPSVFNSQNLSVPIPTSAPAFASDSWAAPAAGQSIFEADDVDPLAWRRGG